MFKTVITSILRDVKIWNDDFVISQNKNIRGQSFSYFIRDNHNNPLFIAKFFNYLKGINIPDSIDISTVENIDSLIEKLADCDDFGEDIDHVSDLVYYNKRSFRRYIEVCNEEDSQFPKVLFSGEDIKIQNCFYSLLIEEVVNGITLEEHLKDFDGNRIELAIKFLWDMSHIVEKFVEHDVVHRDLSPDNIMIHNENIRVIDPGVVKIVNRNSTAVGYIMGKRQYVSPEQYKGYALTADFTSDLYTIGVVAFEIVTKINPIKMYMDKYSPHPHEELISKFDREVEDIFFEDIEESRRNQQLFLILGKLLQVDRKNRFNTIDSCIETLRVLKEGELNE